MTLAQASSTNPWFQDPRYDDPDSACIVTHEGIVTFAEACRRARRLRAFVESRLTDSSSHEPARVSYFADPDPDVHVLFLALFGMGLTAVPVHPKLTASEVDVIHSVARPDLILNREDLALAARDTRLDGKVQSLRATPDAEAPAAIVFTSGTTGVPKGALLSRRAFLASARASGLVLGWEDNDRWFLCLPLAHVGGLGVLVRCLLAKRAVVHFGRRAFDPREVLASMRSARATIASLAPTMLAKFVEGKQPPPDALRVALLGGAAAAPSLVAKGRALGWPLIVTYGLTEACSHVTLGSVRDAGDHVGLPIPGTEVRIVGGQVAVRSGTLFSGYVDQGPLPVDGEGYYATGDLGEIDPAGHLVIHSRRTDLIVTGGENVYPREVELIVEAVDGVKECAVFGVPDDTWGQLVALAVVVEPGGPDLVSIIEQLRLRVASHKRPRLGVIVDSLPSNALGKILRTRLRELEPRLVRLA
jgi:O-succinylbenzoic acid--CoA ligase